MRNQTPSGHLWPSYSPALARAIGRSEAAIAALDTRISGSPVATPWKIRAAWTGYTQALKLQGGEIEEIDVFSWGCGLRLPARPLINTAANPFDAFADWQRQLATARDPAWRDSLPAGVRETPGAQDHPPLIRALDLVRQRARTDSGPTPWLSTPRIMCGLGLTDTPLPSLVGGIKAFRLKRAPTEPDWLVAINAIASAARTGLERLDDLERHHRHGLRAILQEYRPGALPRLLAWSQVRPLLSPQSAAEALGLSIAGASKLLDRAAAAGLFVEVTQRKTWRIFLTPDLAVLFGFQPARRGRPRLESPALPVDRDLASVIATFDQEMAEIDRLLGTAPLAEKAEPGA